MLTTNKQRSNSVVEIGVPWWLRWWRICLQCSIPGFDFWVRKIPWSREWQPTPVFLPGELHGQRSLAGYSPCDGKEADMTELLPLPHFSVWRGTFFFLSTHVIAFNSHHSPRVSLTAWPWTSGPAPIFFNINLFILIGG